MASAPSSTSLRPSRHTVWPLRGQPGRRTNVPPQWDIIEVRPLSVDLIKQEPECEPSHVKTVDAQELAVLHLGALHSYLVFRRSSSFYPPYVLYNGILYSVFS